MSDTYGYCAVIIPQLRAWQGYFIRDEPELRAQGQEMMGMIRSSIPDFSTAYEASQPFEDRVFGALQASMAELFVEGNSNAVGAAALMIGEHYGHRYFAVISKRDAAGTVTSFRPLEGVDDVDEARTAIKRIPEVQLIEVGNIIHGQWKPTDGSHRRRSI